VVPFDDFELFDGVVLFRLAKLFHGVLFHEVRHVFCLIFD
jgi:hypothetical protein